MTSTIAISRRAEYALRPLGVRHVARAVGAMTAGTKAVDHGHELLADLERGVGTAVGTKFDTAVQHDAFSYDAVVDAATDVGQKRTVDLSDARARDAHAIAENGSIRTDAREATSYSRLITNELTLDEADRVCFYQQVCQASVAAGKTYETDPERRHYFFCDCRSPGLGLGFIHCLRERPNWHAFPSSKWFTNPKNGAFLFCPAGKRAVDFADQASFSLTVGGCPGSDWLEDKSRLARLIVPLGLMVPTWFIRDGKWVGEAPGGIAQKEDLFGAAREHVWHDVWFVKAANLNFGVGVAVKASPEQCLLFARAKPPGVTFVVQPSVANPRVDSRGHKLGWRVYVACVSPQNSSSLRWFMFCGGYLVAADGVLRRQVLEQKGHCTKDRVSKFNEWDEFELYEPVMREKITQMLREAQPRMKPPVAKGAFELFGVDLIVGGDDDPGDDPGDNMGNTFDTSDTSGDDTNDRPGNDTSDTSGDGTDDRPGTRGDCTSKPPGSIPNDSGKKNKVPSTVWIVEVNRSPRVKKGDKNMLHALLNIALPKYGLPQRDAVWDLLDVDPDLCDTWHNGADEEQVELNTWGRTRWDATGGRDEERVIASKAE